MLIVETSEKFDANRNSFGEVNLVGVFPIAVLLYDYIESDHLAIVIKNHSGKDFLTDMLRLF